MLSTLGAFKIVCLFHIVYANELWQILQNKLESSVVEELNVPKMIDKYPL